jgi:hypothetical protein
VFSLTQVLVSALSGVVLSLVVLALYSRWPKHTPIERADVALIAIVVGLSILVWREAGNTAALNEDPIPVVSPNDVLCPVVTYVSLSVLAGFRATLQRSDWPRLRAWLTLLSLLVNIATI